MDRFRNWLTTMHRRIVPLCLLGALFVGALNSERLVEGGELGAIASLMANDASPSEERSDSIQAFQLFIDRKLLTIVGFSAICAAFDLEEPDSNTELDARAVSALDSSAGFRTVVRANGSRADCQVPSA